MDADEYDDSRSNQPLRAVRPMRPHDAAILNCRTPVPHLLAVAVSVPLVTIRYVMVHVPL